MFEHLSFKASGEHYQKRILEKSDSIMADGHIHLVAAQVLENDARNWVSVVIVSRRLFSADCNHSSAVGGPYS